MPDSSPVTHVDRATATANLEAAFAGVAALLEELAPDDWHRPTALPGWDVQANAVHIFSTEAMLLGEAAPEVEVDPATLPHVRNDIGAANEAWVLGWADASPEEVVAALRDRAARRLEAIRAMDDDAWHAEGFTPAGRDTYGRFMRIRVMDVWMHEQDIRRAIGRPGGLDTPGAQHTADYLVETFGYVLGKRVSPPAGTTAVLVVEGSDPVAVEVGEDGRGRPLPAVPDEPAVRLDMDRETFILLAGGRRTPGADAVRISGDADLGQRIVDHLATTP